ncbi:MAG: CrcB family protein [Micrococcaceae bacterium]|nr:CrcB family protein [Micrococcaceae bacterium]
MRRCDHTKRTLPVGTILINFSGSLLLGLVGNGLVPAQIATTIGGGLLGGNTTFSIASVETIRLAEQHRYGAPRSLAWELSQSAHSQPAPGSGSAPSPKAAKRSCKTPPNEINSHTIEELHVIGLQECPRSRTKNYASQVCEHLPVQTIQSCEVNRGEKNYDSRRERS